MQKPIIIDPLEFEKGMKMNERIHNEPTIFTKIAASPILVGN